MVTYVAAVLLAGEGGRRSPLEPYAAEVLFVLAVAALLLVGAVAAVLARSGDAGTPPDGEH